VASLIRTVRLTRVVRKPYSRHHSIQRRTRRRWATRNHAARLKAKVAWVAITGDKGLAELTEQCEVFPKQISA
jgi:hypothetical protein